MSIPSILKLNHYPILTCRWGKLHSQLKDIQSDAKSLTEAGIGLNALFTAERIRLKREDEASSLRAVYHAILEQLQRLQRIEASASIGNSRANLILSLSGAALTALVSKGNRLSAVADYLCRSTTGKQPFGLVMIGIGPGDCLRMCKRLTYLN